MKNPRVYVLYTGGTIGMQDRPLQPMTADEFHHVLLQFPSFRSHSLTIQSLNSESFEIEFELEQAVHPPIDSSSMVPHQWIEIASLILRNYEAYDGFVVLHGTDTMAWTSSALSYLLQGLSKPVILTGSQIPIVETRSDAFRNLITAMYLAAKSKIPEVGLFFNVHLMRGNRAVKVSTNAFNGFESPNFPPLAVAGIDVEVDRELVLPPPLDSDSLEHLENRQALIQKLQNIEKRLAEFSVVALQLFPGISASMTEAFMEFRQPPVKGVILEAFGAGNAPSGPEFLQKLTEANARGVTIMDNTQCLMGTVNIDAYHSASGLKAAGVVSAYDLTPEATMTKLIYWIGQGLEQAEVKQRMQIPLHGDLTPPRTESLS